MSSWKSYWSVLCKSCKEREIKAGSWVFKEFSMKLEVFWDLREFAKSMRLDFITECLDKRPRDPKDLLEGWGRKLWIKGHRRECVHAR